MAVEACNSFDGEGSKYEDIAHIELQHLTIRRAVHFLDESIGVGFVVTLLSVDVDVDVCDMNGNAILQIEALHVTSVSQATKNDYSQKISNSVWDPDQINQDKDSPASGRLAGEVWICTVPGFRQLPIDEVAAGKHTTIKLRKTLKPGGHLALLDFTDARPVKQLFISNIMQNWWAGANDEENIGNVEAPHSTLAQFVWHDILRETSFSGIDSSAPKTRNPLAPFSVMVTQLRVAR
ncbi:hypothetical protein F5Y18DRAFT_429137 [Xylariaceae sp. FL1019]|nr:hypothetical protein F5Y18DRAFT_429137 [Xylariaceae sp. FL1019]